MWVYLDDERYPSPEFDEVFNTNKYILVVRTGKELIDFINSTIDNSDIYIDGISFDNDLGDTSNNLYSEGYKCLNEILKLMATTKLYIPNIRIHTSNSVASLNMSKAIENFNKHFGKAKQINCVWDPAHLSECDEIDKRHASKFIKLYGELK